MKKIEYYMITKEQFDNTEYRPDVTHFELTVGEGNDGCDYSDWNYSDVLMDNGDGYYAEKATETSDGLIVWKVFSMEDCEENDYDHENIPVGYTVEVCSTNTQKWYAVQRDGEDEWGKGSYDYDEAVDMLRQQGYGQIAVISMGNDPICVGEISYEEAVRS